MLSKSILFWLTCQRLKLVLPVISWKQSVIFEMRIFYSGAGVSESHEKVAQILQSEHEESLMGVSQEQGKCLFPQYHMCVLS